MSQSFSELLRDLVGTEHGAQTEFATSAGSSLGFVHNVIVGAAKPPKKTATLERWADALSLKGQKREEFILAGILERTPKEIRQLIVDLKAGIAELEERLDRMERQRPRVADGDQDRSR